MVETVNRMRCLSFSQLRVWVVGLRIMRVGLALCWGMGAS